MDPTLPGNQRLEDTLRALARQDDALRPSPHVEAQLRARVQALRPSSTEAGTPARATWHAWAGAAAAAVLFVLIWRLVPSQPPERITARDVPAPTLRSDFLPLPYAHVPVATGHIVRMSVPRTALATFGLDPGRAGDTRTVLADVFVGEDGIARSVRFVDPAIQEDTVQ